MDMDDGTLLNAINTVQKEEKFMADNGQIRSDLQNAATMLSYIVDKGLELKREHLETIVNCRDKYNSGKWTKLDEINFYLTYTELTKIIKPVTVDSLASSRPSIINNVGKIGAFFGRTQKMPLSKRSATGYTLSTLFFVVILLIIQIYYYLGSTRLNEINNCEQETEIVNNRLKEVRVILDKDPENTQYTNEEDRLISRLEEFERKRLSNSFLLMPWIKYIRMVTFRENIQNDPLEYMGQQTSVEVMKPEKIARVITALIQEARSYVLILGIYVLPLLYGIIGGFTFVLRELNNEINELTFSSGSNIKYLLRILLGAIAGLSIGLFWGDIQKAEQFGLSSLSPMLLAFLGGYCVEYLLQFFEKLINTFFNKHLSFYEKQPVVAPESGAKVEVKEESKAVDGEDAAMDKNSSNS